MAVTELIDSDDASQEEEDVNVVDDDTATEESNIIPRKQRTGSRRNIASDLEGLRRLSTDAVTHTTRLVEVTHSRWDWLSNQLFADRGEDKVRNPIAGLVYGSIHLINGMVGATFGLVLSALEPWLDESVSSTKRDAALAVLNGVVGDYLQQQENPLAITMEFRVDAVPQTDELLRDLIAESSHGRILLLIHGSCSNDLQWTTSSNTDDDGCHDHGTVLGEALDMVPLYLHYNSGLHISENGKLLAAQLDRLVGLSSMQPLTISIVAHSMGGLVARSACSYAESDPDTYNVHDWLGQVDNLVMLGSPHHGALLERGGKWVDYLLSLHPYIEPFSWLGKIRSHGVSDLGFGNVRDEDWRGDAHTPPESSGSKTGTTNDSRRPTPLPPSVECFAIAALSSEDPSTYYRDKLVGDGLVTENSALGVGDSNPLLNLQIPASHRHTVRGTSHIGLLSSTAVCAVIRSFLERTNSNSDKKDCSSSADEANASDMVLVKDYTNF